MPFDDWAVAAKLKSSYYAAVCTPEWLVNSFIVVPQLPNEGFNKNGYIFKRLAPWSFNAL